MIPNKFFFVAVAVIGVVFCVYFPGLFGDFMLDDHGNLPPLFNTMEVYGFWVGVFDGGAGPLGRPISLLTFAVQHSSWPTPFSFKLVNLVIHIVNTVLAILVVKKVAPLLAPKLSKTYLYLPYAVGLIWALLPIQVSSVLYVVQRMTLLSSTFMLAGILAYFGARVFIVEGRWLKGYAAMVIGVGSCLLLGMFSKETGFTLLLYLLVVEACIQAKRPIKNNILRGLLLTGLWAPVCLFVAYIVVRWSSWEQVWLLREFTAYERVITQWAILFGYLKSTLFPLPSDLGLYHDAYPITKGIFSSASSIICALAILASVVVAFIVKRSGNLIIFFCIAWYMAGHLMEGSVIPLELYFEHRNYLPSLAVVLGIVLAIILLLETSSKPIVKYSYIGLFGLYGVYLLVTTIGQTILWGSPNNFKMVYISERQNSVRAQSLAVSHYQMLGDPKKAYAELLRIEKTFPRELSVEFSKLEFGCYYPDLFTVKPNLAVWEEKVEKARFSHATLKSMDDMLEYFGSNTGATCKNFSAKELELMMLAVLENPLYSWKKGKILRTLSLLMFNAGNIERALMYAMLVEEPEVEFGLYKIRLLGTLGEYDIAVSEVNNILENLGYGVKDERFRENATSLLEQLLLDERMLETGK